MDAAPQITTEPSTTRRRIEGLDLLRGLAVALVITHHTWPDLVSAGGIVGVVIFFCLSGYLITGLLEDDIERFGQVRYGRFYWNRAVRLMPALILMLSALTLVTATIDPLGEKAGLGRAVIVALTYTGNLPFNHGSSATTPLWTLATEEQFYLIWPVMLVLAIRFRNPALLMAVSMLGVIGACFLTMVLTRPNIHQIYSLPTSWAITILIGSAARLWSARFASIQRKSIWRVLRSTIALAGLLTLSFAAEAKDSSWTYLVMGPAVALLTVLLIFHLKDWGSIPTPWLKPLLVLGQMSYAAYLWNYPMLLWLGKLPVHVNSDMRSVVTKILVVLATLIMAAISWWVVEKPISNWNRKRNKEQAIRVATNVQGVVL
jgi:peptidoglycan/LPS O-acetylase OafA/YrhL